MRINIKDLRDLGPRGQDVELVGPMSFDDLPVCDPVKIKLHLAQAGDRVRLLGTVSSALVRTCSRCDSEFVAPLEAGIEEYFIPAHSPEARFNQALSAEEMNVFTYEDNHIDLVEVIRQNLISAIPMRPLCKEDCKGLCPFCGQDLNLKDCGCAESTKDA